MKLEREINNHRGTFAWLKVICGNSKCSLWANKGSLVYSHCCSQRKCIMSEDFNRLIQIYHQSQKNTELQTELIIWEYFVYQFKKLICYWFISHRLPWLKLCWKLPNLYPQSRTIYWYAFQMVPCQWDEVCLSSLCPRLASLSPNPIPNLLFFHNFLSQPMPHCPWIIYLTDI